jgi:PAS domain S-box-containing protein
MDNDGMFRELVENSDDILIVTDHEFKIRYISSSVKKTFLIEPLKLLGENIFSFASPDKIERWRACLQDSSFTSFQDEISLKIAPGKKNYFDVQVSNLFNRSNIRGLFISLHDITKKKTKEQELQRSNEQMDQVIYKTTHDLKAPLRSALGLVNLAERATPEEQEKYLGLIKKSLYKLDSFIEEMNIFFRSEKLALQNTRIDLKEILQDELSNFNDLTELNKITVDLTVNQSTDFYSDSIRLKTIVGNLLSNAVKYFDSNKSESFIKISVSVNDETCQLQMVDNGIGIAPEYQERIFELFFRATDVSEGTGLGLFIVKDTVEKLSGKIEVLSQLGEGTTFTINLPNQIFHPIVMVQS